VRRECQKTGKNRKENYADNPKGFRKDMGEEDTHEKRTFGPSKKRSGGAV